VANARLAHEVGDEYDHPKTSYSQNEQGRWRESVASEHGHGLPLRSLRAVIPGGQDRS
jgi:hypothetical protein